MYESIMSEEMDMDYQNEEECGVNEPHVDCSDAFNTYQDVLRWTRSIAHENGFVAVIIRSDTNIGSRGKTSFVLIDCERSGEYRCRKNEFVRRDTRTRKCGCPFKLRGKPVVGGQGWMVKLMCGIHNHKLDKSLVGHPYAGRLTKAEKTLIVDMTKSMIKPRNILLTLKEHNANSCMTIKQIYNTRSAYRSSIRGSDTEMQHLMKLLERDQYIHWHRLKDEDVVHDIFWCHPGAVKLINACNLVFLIDNTYKTNRYRLSLLDFVGMTPIGMTFSAGFAYLEGERLNNVIATEFERVHYAGKNHSTCGCVMRTTHGLPCSYEPSKYDVGCIPLDSVHMFWRRLSFSDQGLSESEVSIKEEMKTISKRFEELGVCGKFTLKTKLQEIAYPNQNSMCHPPAKVNSKGAPKKPMNRNPRSTKRDPSYWEYVDAFHSKKNRNSSMRRNASSSEQPNPRRMMPMLDQFQSFIHDFIDNTVDVQADGNYGYRSVAGLLGMGEDSWSLVCTHLLKELGKFS
ncbi:Protein FAR1-RELATED SEQUENCE 5 [Glycine max]|nr:Protein FAR1-RELATED SEQUENCE 5 [Glycine max]